jgi:ribosomal-protein-alanine N-acetyltransferase
MSAPTAFLKGDQVYLRALAEADANGAYVEWFNDAEVSAENGHHYWPFTTGEALAYIERSATAEDDVVFAIAACDDDRHIGNVTLKRINWIWRSAEFAIVIGDKSVWGKGYGKEVGRLVLDYAFEVLNLRRVHCATFETNVAMQKLALFLGMREEGRRRQAAFKSNRYLDVVEFGVLRDEYAASKQ